MTQTFFHRWIILVTLFGSALAFSAAKPVESSNTSSVEQRFAKAGWQLPAPYRPAGNFVTAVRTGNLVFLGGHGECGSPNLSGKVGAERTVAEAREAAKNTMLCLLSLAQGGDREP